MRWGSFLCLALALALWLPPAHAGIETSARQAFMVDMATGAVLLNKSGDEAMHPSSMSKLMTVYLLFTRLKEGRVKLDSQFTISEKAWRMQGSKSFVPIGGKISVEELIHAIITQSGNDACLVVAEGLSGSEEAFVKEMNRAGKAMGLARSHFVNATGMPEDAHLMSARDLATLSQRLITDFPDYYHYFGIAEYTYNNIKQQNRNRLLARNIGVDGLKTGHTEAGGYGIALSAKQDERRLILVINGMKSDNERVEEGDKLLRWGFREFDNKTLLRKGRKVDEASVWFGTSPTVPLVAGEEVLLTLPANGDPKIKMTLKYTGPVQAPIAKDAHIADLVIQSEGSPPRTIPLLAGEDVSQLSGFSHIAAVLRHYVSNRKSVAP